MRYQVRVPAELILIGKAISTMEGIAQELAASLASGDVSRERAQQRADQAIAGLGNRFSAVLTVMTVLGDPEQAGLDSVADGSLGHFGLGLAQGSDPNLGDGAIYVVILLAKAR